MHDLVWPTDFLDVGGKPFSWVYQHRKEFVDFTLKEMDNPTGLFRKWKTYCKNRKKQASNNET